MSEGTHLHATAVTVAGSGLLIRGRSGSGKSSLAVSLLQRAAALGWPARLVADDQVLARRRGDGVDLHAPETIAGLIELRGVGLLRLPHAPFARLDLVVDLVERDAIERLPEPARVEILGLGFPRIALPCRDPAFGADILATLLGPGVSVAPTGPRASS